MSAVGSSSIVGGPRSFLELVVGGLARAEIGDRGSHQQHVAAVELSFTGCLKLRRSLDLDDPDGGGRRQPRVGGQQRHLGPTTGRLPREREPHPARGAVADVANAVDRLAGAAGGDEHPDAEQRV